MEDVIFVVSKQFWIIAEPANLLLLGLWAGLIFTWVGWQRWGGRLLTLVAVIYLVVATVPVGQWLTTVLENRFPILADVPGSVEGIIVLAGAADLETSEARGQVALNENAERLTTFVSLARRYPEAKLVFTGGTGSLARPDLKEADIVRPLIRDLGLDLGRVLFERDSRNTYENAVNSRELVKPAEGGIWLLITSAAHMPRAVGVFRRTGWPVVPYPVDFNTDGRYLFELDLDAEAGLGLLSASLREVIGLAVYRLFGRTDSLFPGPASAGGSD